MRPRSAEKAARASFVLAATVLAASCTGDSGPTGVAPEAVQPQQLISDAYHSGKPHFFFLTPISHGNPAATGAFDPLLAPRVEICVLASGACAGVIASYGSGTVALEPTNGGAYNVNWNTRNFDLNVDETYRIRVLVEDIELGFADVDLMRNGSEMRNVLTDEYIPLVDGATLPIRFRVEEGFLGRIAVTPNPASVVVTMTQQFEAAATDLHGNVLPATFTWSSGDGAIATVDGSGLATGIADGQVQIIATAAGASGSALLDVIGVARIGVIPDTATASPGGTQQYVATLYDDADSVITGPPIVWSSSAEAIATVDSAGLATAVAAGDATITATAAGVGGTALLHVVNVARIEVVPAAASANQGRTQDFDAILYDAYDNDVTGQYPVSWTTSDATVATVDSTGLATGLMGGVVSVVATSEGAVGSAVFEVIGIDRIEVNPAEATIALGETQQFEAVVYDANDNVMTGYAVAWATADPAIATVDQDGLATGVANGEVRILAMAEGVEGSALLHVEGGSRIEVRPLQASVLPGGTAQFEAIQYDANDNVIPGNPVTWSTSNAAVAIVDQNGLALALTSGVAIIRATTGTLTGEATLTVAGRTAMAPMKSTWTSMTAEDVNDDGIVVGHLREGSSNRPFKWYSTGTGSIDYADSASVTVLPMGGAPNCWAYGIGDGGTIVGRCAYTTGARAVYWRPDGTGPVNMQGDRGFARGIYEGPEGTFVTGTAFFAGFTPPTRVVRWSSLSAAPTGVNAPQECPQASIPDGMGYGVNRDQAVTGDVTAAVTTVLGAGVWGCALVKRSFKRTLVPNQITGSGHWYVPCNQYGSDCGTSTGRAINASGVVVGFSAYARSTYPTIVTVPGAFYWVPGAANPRAAIPGLPSYANSGITDVEARSEAHGINDLGWAVGYYGATKAFLWRGPTGGPAETLEPYVENTPVSARAVSEPSPSGQYAGKVFVAGNGRTPENKAGVVRWVIEQ